MSSSANKLHDSRLAVMDTTGPIELREDHVGDIRGDTLVVNVGVSAMSAVHVRELYVHGTLRGVVDADVVVVAKTGRIIGSVSCNSLRVKGVVEGGMIAGTVLLRDGGRLEGDIVSDKVLHTDDTTIVGQASIGPGMVARRREAGGAPKIARPAITPEVVKARIEPAPAEIATEPLRVEKAPPPPPPLPTSPAPDRTPRNRVKPYLLPLCETA